MSIKEKTFSQIHAKYVDDLSLAKAIKLKEDLTVDNNLNFTMPLTFHNKIGLLYVTAILTWGYGWGWVDVDIEAEVEMRLSQSLVELELR